MTLLLERQALVERRGLAAGPLSPLAKSLRADLAPLGGEDIRIPGEKAMLSRDGGRCPRDGASLAFDPYEGRRHRCPRCGQTYEGERHYLWWVMSRHLWLSERALHAATLFAVTGDADAARLAAEILGGYADQYASYPNRDNVLGPSRPFFSTYLESIWLLQLALTLDLLEISRASHVPSQSAREKLLEPSLELIAGFDEGASNRQVWSNAAILAAGQLVDRSPLVRRAVNGPSGLHAHLEGALLTDGTWYEGENYHLFAHRGLWYGVVLAERAGIQLPDALADRFAEAFAAPLLTMLPDFTFPARRDSRYGVSLRNWRFAESCELGLARANDARLTTALGHLYGGEVPRVGTGRSRSAAEAEQPEPASDLSRADLSWKSLLFALDHLPELPVETPRTVLLDGQGIAVFRRRDAQTFLALDYGQSGGGHGHPDRLNLLLVDGGTRWLDDMGTGSYVDPSLHWYRSTLAHNAPLADGRSQLPGEGTLLAFEERGAAGWAQVELPPGVLAANVHGGRTLVVMPDYALDQLVWQAGRPVVLDLPFHVDAGVQGVGAWAARTPAASDAPADGFAAVHDCEAAVVKAGAVIHLRSVNGERALDAWVMPSAGAELWRGVAPGPPERGDRRFHWLRLHERAGGITTVWSWDGAVREAHAREGVLTVELTSGERHEHARHERLWHVELFAAGARSSIDLAGIRRKAKRDTPPPNLRAMVPSTVPRVSAGHPRPVPLLVQLGEREYRQSEETWRAAGMPTATVTLLATERDLECGVIVTKSPLFFRAADAQDPALDNEPADIHSDGVQIYISSPAWDREAGWLLVPEAGGEVRNLPVAGMRNDVPVRTSWRPTPSGYEVRIALSLSALGRGPDYPFSAGVLVNDMSP
ncbi:MAG TPA: heparinase II/III family protein, partial [Gemmatimonadaceae bacterium]|nr:heparinase II/III family protein [Gemmatimonadaceae bacterium]